MAHAREVVGQLGPQRQSLGPPRVSYAVDALEHAPVYAACRWRVAWQNVRLAVPSCVAASTHDTNTVGILHATCSAGLEDIVVEEVRHRLHSATDVRPCHGHVRFTVPRSALDFGRVSETSNSCTVDGNI